MKLSKEIFSKGFSGHTSFYKESQLKWPVSLGLVSSAPAISIVHGHKGKEGGTVRASLLPRKLWEKEAKSSLRDQWVGIGFKERRQRLLGEPLALFCFRHLSFCWPFPFPASLLQPLILPPPGSGSWGSMQCFWPHPTSERWRQGTIRVAFPCLKPMQICFCFWLFLHYPILLSTTPYLWVNSSDGM